MTQPRIRYAVGLAPMGCYIVRYDPDEEPETVRVGIKSYASACKTANALEQEANTAPVRPS